MKHAKASTPRDVAIDMLNAVGARRGEIGGRHRAAVPGDEWTPSSKLADRQPEVSDHEWTPSSKLADRQPVVPEPRHRAAS